MRSAQSPAKYAGWSGRNLAAATRGTIQFLALALACLTATPVIAEIRALLVGVSDYQFLDADLRGPANDVGLMARALMARGARADDISVLAAPDAKLPEGVVNAGLPTRAAILDGLDSLAVASGAMTQAVFYFSGHGTQMPDLNGDENGGPDEVFLPADAKGWSGAAGAVENAIVDDELAPRMQAILDRGAHLAAIIDACHAETGFRALPEGAATPVARYIAPGILNIPTDLTPNDTALAMPTLVGDFAFLYAAQSNQRAFEYPVGQASDPGNWYGDFTRNIAFALESGAALTWSDLLQRAMAGMNAGSPTTQTPDAEGTLLDAPVLGQREPRLPLIRLAAGRLLAGALQGVQSGAIYEISSMPGGATVAEVTVSAVGPISASLEAAAALPSQGFARLKVPGRPDPIRLAGPVVADESDYATLQSALAHLRSAAAPDGVVWGEGPADLTLVLTGGTLALAGRDGAIDGAGPGSAPRLKDGEDPNDFLERAARTLRLRSAVQQVSSGRTGISLPGLGPKYRLDHIAVASQDDACVEATAAAAPVRKAVTVTRCDQLWLEVHNTTRIARDVTVLYIDSDNHVTAIWPDNGLSNRVAFDERIEAGLAIANPEPQRHGLEELLILAVPAVVGTPRTVLTGLADPVATRDIPADAPASVAWLLQASLPDGATRNLSLPGPMSPLEVTRFAIRLVPE